MELYLLKDLIIIFGLSILVIYIFHLLKLPSIIGFLLTGILVGPHGLELVKATHEVELMAEIGVILLLFTIGIEFSLKNLIRVRRSMLIGGSLQVFLVTLVAGGIAYALGVPLNQSVFIGFLVSLSSTAIVLKMLQNKGEVGSLAGQTSVAILIFQDIIIVPMILLTPILAGKGNALGEELLLLLLKGAGLFIFVYVSSKWIIPRLLLRIARTQSKELFMITIIALGFALAWLTSSIGLSLALGAFIGGLIISESEYSEQAFGNIVPFRDVFTSFFFVSVGMLLNLEFVFQNPVLVLMITLGVLLIKTIISGFAAFILGFPFRTTVLVGLTLSQIGEFSFILSKIGMDNELLAGDNYQIFLAVSVLTLALTPFIINAAPRLADSILKFPLPNKLRCGLRDIPEIQTTSISDHVIIVGFGINGRNVARATNYGKIPHVIIEMNPDTVKEELAKGETILYGDASQEEVLKHANIEKAMILVITIPHPMETKRITTMARSLSPHLHIIIRTRFINEMKNLYELGANEVIPEEFETSIEIFTRVLAKYLISTDEIEKLVAQVRADGYEMFRSMSIEEDAYSQLKVSIPQVDINSIQVCEKSPMVGKKLSECIFFKENNVPLLAISRRGKVIPKPTEDEQLEANDILYVLGTATQIYEINPYFKEALEGSGSSCV